MKHGRTSAIVCSVGLMMSLLMARAHPFGDAGLYAAASARTPIAKNNSVPPEVRAILVAKCADCHSEEAHPPVYGRFAPVSWMLERHIVAGRKALDLDAWNSYSAEQQQTFEAKIVQETKAQKMPLPSYRMIHWNARITDADVKTLVQWVHAESLARDAAEAPVVVAPVVSVKRVVAAPVLVAMDQPADAVRGKDVFERRCTGCHAMTEDREGPRMQGVFGRTAGGVAGFNYSAALKQAHLVWDEKTLDAWLTDPDALVPGNDMDFHVAKAQERKDLIRYLRESGK